MPNKTLPTQNAVQASRLQANRRQVLGGLAASLLANPTFAQGPSTTKPAVPAFSLMASPILIRLAEPAGPESTIFGLIPDPNKPNSVGMLERHALLRLKPQVESSISLTNRLGQPLSLGIRGLRTSIAAEKSLLTNDENSLLTFVAQQAGSFLLHPTTPGFASEQTGRGLSTLLVIDEAAPPPVDHDLPLLVSDWRLDEKGMLEGGFGDLRDAARLGRLGNRLVVNGRAAPAAMTVRPGARIRLRIANTAMARVIPLHVSGLNARVIAIDSTPCQPFDPLQRMVTLAPGTRCEVILDMPVEAGKDARVEARFATPTPLFSFRTEGEALASRGLVIALPDPGLPPAIRLQDAQRVDFTITGGISRADDAALEAIRREAAGLEAYRKAFPDPRRVFAINGGTVGDRPGEAPGQPLLRARKGRVVVLALRNQTGWAQVIGIGGHSFRLLHPYDDGWEPYFLDTLYLAPGAVARVAFIAEASGRHAIRSTIADHADAGVATHFEVT
ncbi:MAG: multicopper oxidase family protein [Rhabdaerophilum sp.]